MHLYEHALKKGALRPGIELRSVNWGNQTTMNLGYRAGYISKDNWMLSGITTMGLGFALFQQNPLFVWSVGYMPVLTWLRHKKVDFTAGFGIRYTNSPAYRNYGKINQVLEFPIKIGLVFNLQKNQQ